MTKKLTIDLLDFADHLNSYEGFEEVRFDFMVMDYLDKTIKMKPKPKPKPKCYNCKHASSAFKIAGKTHHQCNHPKHEEGFKSGKLSPWDTLQEFYNTCETHELKSTST